MKTATTFSPSSTGNTIDGISLETRGRLTAVGGGAFGSRVPARPHGDVERHARAWLALAARDARAEGATWAAIARVLGCSPTTAARLAKEAS